MQTPAIADHRKAAVHHLQCNRSYFKKVMKVLAHHLWILQDFLENPGESSMLNFQCDITVNPWILHHLIIAVIVIITIIVNIGAIADTEPN